MQNLLVFLSEIRGRGGFVLSGWVGSLLKISTKTLGWFYSDFQGAFFGFYGGFMVIIWQFYGAELSIIQFRLWIIDFISRKARLVF